MTRSGKLSWPCATRCGLIPLQVSLPYTAWFQSKKAVSSGAARSFGSMGQSICSPRPTSLRIRAAEVKRSHIVLASPYVIMELASHLAEESDPAFKQCRCALRALAHHCQVHSEERLYMLADSESLVAKSLFEAEVTGHA